MTGSVWSSIHGKLHRTLRCQQLLPASQRLLVAVSGGQDSLCLMQILLDLQPKWSWELAIAHCNHGWRMDADANAHHVAQLAEAWGVPYFYRHTTGLPPTEAAGRCWRYTTLAEIVQSHGYSGVVTGHTASDRAETLLYNLVRGSGSDGLQALTWKRTLPTRVGSVLVIRPLLGIYRWETLAFCRDRNLRVWGDETNRSLTYARNRIREDILPYLAEHLNGGVERHLAQTADLLMAEVDYLETVTDTWWKQLEHVAQGILQSNLGDWSMGEIMMVNQVGASDDRRAGRFPLHRFTLSGAPLAIQRRIIRRWLRLQLGLEANFNQVEKVVSLIPAPNGSQSDPFKFGIMARVRDGWLVLSR
ncbi:MAG: tRNA lysidine(34) synthetase TilS [Cyanobacteria bacterium WB6_1B_304]|jgi:tRNA(Ile)-lysidine synthase|nr:tRNA lysidine(34) synthetase TilS [Cyanobacteria bacterium WB6_1B_304]